MILIAMDSWKGSLSAREAGEAVAEGIRRVRPDLHTQVAPLADGGEGTLSIVADARPGEFIRKHVMGPLPDRTVDSRYLFWPDTREALIEMALCAGLPLLKPEERNPLLTTTHGVGEWIRDAAERGATGITLALGGSATVDGGTGMARALGWRFVDADGQDLPEGGGALTRLDSVIPPDTPLSLEVRVMCDVTNPLLGPKGAATVFGPQKGATPEQVEQLECGLSRLAAALEKATGVAVADLPGAGAAGGLGAGCVGFLGGALVSGIDEMLRISGLREQIGEAYHVVTGEGRIDSQSLEGKVVSGILQAAAPSGVPVSVIAGSCALQEAEWKEAGIYSAWSANREGLPVAEAMRRAAGLAADAGAAFAETLSGSS